MTWINLEQHMQHFLWWNNRYRSAKSKRLSAIVRFQERRLFSGALLTSIMSRFR
jgi:hypothetical protein